MRRVALLLALLGAAHAVNVRVLVAAAPEVRVRVPIAAPPAYPSATPGTAVPAAPATFAEWAVGVRGARLTLNGQDGGGDSLYLPPAPGSVVGIGDKSYRGGVLLRANAGRVDAINVLDLEDYLRGVVPAEMPSGWAPEALKAQAVIARSYAVARINPASAYDLCATDQCQMYGGLAREATGASLAVDATRGLVVSYAGQIAKTFFSSDSGGFTASAGEVWGSDLPYLIAQPDPASRGPKSAWNFSVPLSQVANVAARYRVRVGALQSVSVSRQSASGRPLELSFFGSGGAARLEGAEAGGFVRALGAYSTRVTLSGRDPLVVSGAGAGHGVGLSQYGASGLAQGGWNYAQILGFYYPGAAMSAIEERAALPFGGQTVDFASTLRLPHLAPDLSETAAAPEGDVLALGTPAAE